MSTIFRFYVGGCMKAGILAIGTELLMGQTVNTNATYLSKEMNELGIGVYFHNTVGDNPIRIKEALRTLLSACDLILVTGGLGPTLDDITKEVVADTLGLQMVLDHRSFDIIKERFRLFNRTMPDSNIRQAYFPEGAIILDNSQGTAPGCIVEADDGRKIIVVLPGPPRELKHMYHTHVKKYLMEKNAFKMHSKYLSVYDLGESSAEEELMDLIMNQINPTLATYAGDGKVLLRVTSSGLSDESNILAVDQMVVAIHDRIGKYIVSDKGEDIDQVILSLLNEKKMTISFAESCTGGKLASALIKHSGASEVVDSGYVVYTNESKVRELGVKEETLKVYGAVSHQTCYEMVKGVMEKTKSDVGISITGIAGPTGGTIEKPVGLVYIGIGINDDIYTFENNFSGGREMVQDRAVIKALKLLFDYIRG
ncbi:MAG TPA: competence/damage-inducible protein A [Clostridiales bacterium UBA8960]|jgi:nicotinamide-nucleotide amidase|nr:competence/damage-inducible protein A [Clostridiales bacterium UBA8960]